MRKRTKLKIGEFSKLMQVTVKTLRHYEQIGLLVPDEVDQWSGYRYYTLDQMQKLKSIRQLKDIGFSLVEIKDIYDEDYHEPSISQIKAKLTECNRQIRMLQRRRQQLIDIASSHKNIKTMEKFSIQALPAIIVATHRRTIRQYSDLGELCVNVIGPEMHRLGCKCSPAGYCFTIEHNKEYTPTDIDIEYCEQVEEMGNDSEIIKFRQLEEVPKALCMKHYGPYDRFYEAYTEAFKYLEEHGLQIAGQPRTVYVDGAWNQEDPEKWLSIIQIPII